MTNLSAPETDLPNFFRQLGRTSAQVAPVADVQAQLFTNMADTFAAIGFSPPALQDTIAKGPSTLDVGTRSLRAQRPVPRATSPTSRASCGPPCRSCRARCRRSTSPSAWAPRCCRKTVPLNERLQTAFVSLDRLFANPNTLLAFRDIRSALAVTRPLIEFLNPYQSVCNYPVYFLNALGEHMSAKASATFPGGTVQGQGAKLSNTDPAQQHRPERRRPARGHPARPEGARRRTSGSASPRRGCSARPTRRPSTPRATPTASWASRATPTARSPCPAPATARARCPARPPPTGTGGNGAVALSDFPVLTGGTYKSRELGIDNLKDVP